MALSGVCRGSHRVKTKMAAQLCSFLQEALFLFIQGLAAFISTQSLGLRFHRPSWQLAGGCPRFPEGFLRAVHLASPAQDISPARAAVFSLIAPPSSSNFKNS